VAAMSTGAMYPREYVKRSDAPAVGDSCVAANARSDARIGVEHGDAASAKVRPATYAVATGGTGSWRTSMLRDGNDTGRTPSRLRPINTATTPTAAPQ